MLRLYILYILYNIMNSYVSHINYRKMVKNIKQILYLLKVHVIKFFFWLGFKNYNVQMFGLTSGMYLQIEPFQKVFHHYRQYIS